MSEKRPNNPFYYDIYIGGNSTADQSDQLDLEDLSGIVSLENGDSLDLE